MSVLAIEAMVAAWCKQRTFRGNPGYKPDAIGGRGPPFLVLLERLLALAHIPCTCCCPATSIVCAGGKASGVLAIEQLGRIM